MPSYPMPSWIMPSDPAAELLRGVQTGAQIGEAQSRLAEAEKRSAMENQIEQQRLQQNALLEKARLQTQGEYQKQRIALDNERLKEVAANNAARTSDAAMRLQELSAHNQEMERLRGLEVGSKSTTAAQKWEQQQAFTKSVQDNIAKGMPREEAVMQAYVDVGGWTPGISEAVMKGAGRATPDLTPAAGTHILTQYGALPTDLSEEDKKAILERAKNAVLGRKAMVPPPIDLSGAVAPPAAQAPAFGNAPGLVPLDLGGGIGPPVLPPPAPAASPRVFRSGGKSYIYSGTADDPKTDKDPSHWREL